ncbi:MAG: hypothetical protein H5T69_04350 [Chloroflexi bacterium]|nr:hypothetical protein [Chloroflexota bacterium]
MRRRSIGLALTILATFLLTLLEVLSAQAGPLAQQVQVQITSPEMGSRVRGRVPIIGSAVVPNFQFYKVEFGVGPSPAQWAVIGQLHYEPVINGQLEIWDTTVLPDGVYTLRVQGVKKDGNWEEFIVRGIAIANSEPTPTNTPEASPTPLATETPAISPTPTQPRPTATLQIIAPTAALAMPTPTPTLSRPESRSALPVDPESWLESFVFGVVAMGTVFIVLGIVFGLRRLL